MRQLDHPATLLAAWLASIWADRRLRLPQAYESAVGKANRRDPERCCVLCLGGAGAARTGRPAGPCPVTGIAKCLGSRRARDEAATRHEQFRSALSAHIDDVIGLDGELGGRSAKRRQILPPLAFAFISL